MQSKASSSKEFLKNPKKRCTIFRNDEYDVTQTPGTKFDVVGVAPKGIKCMYHSFNCDKNTVIFRK